MGPAVLALDELGDGDGHAAERLDRVVLLGDLAEEVSLEALVEELLPIRWEDDEPLGQVAPEGLQRLLGVELHRPSDLGRELDRETAGLEREIPTAANVHFGLRYIHWFTPLTAAFMAGLSFARSKF